MSTGHDLCNLFVTPQPGNPQTSTKRCLLFRSLHREDPRRRILEVRRADFHESGPRTEGGLTEWPGVPRYTDALSLLNPPYASIDSLTCTGDVRTSRRTRGQL